MSNYVALILSLATPTGRRRRGSTSRQKILPIHEQAAATCILCPVDERSSLEAEFTRCYIDL